MVGRWLHSRSAHATQSATQKGCKQACSGPPPPSPGGPPWTPLSQGTLSAFLDPVQAVRSGDVQTFQQELDGNMHTFCVQVHSSPIARWFTLLVHPQHVYKLAFIFMRV